MTNHMHILKISLLYLFALVLFSNCNQLEHDHDHDHDPAATDEAEHEHEESEDEVVLTNTQIEKIALQFGKLEQKSLNSTLKVNGILELPPQNEADVSALAAGKILSIKVRPGEYVKRGAPLAVLQNPEFIEWQQAYLEAKGELLFVEKEYIRQKDLVAQEIAPQKQFEKISSERAVLQAKLQGLSARLKVLSLPVPEHADDQLITTSTLRSPMEGYVRDIKVNTGVYVEPPQALFEIVDNRHLHIDFLMFEKDLASVQVGQIINFNLQSNPKHLMQAKVFSIGKAINQKDRSISIHAEIQDETSGLIPGMYVEGRIILENETVTALPEEAITMDNGLHYIFVKEDVHGAEVHFKKVPVVLGISDFGYVEIKSMENIAAQAEIALKGAYFLMAQSKKGEAEEGHEH